jgi:hypothetical protein
VVPENRRDMPQIVVNSTPTGPATDGAVVLRERIAVADLESAHFRQQLMERLGWAVGDADEAEQSRATSGEAPATDRRTAGDFQAYSR